MTVAANAASNETAEALVDRALSNIKPPSCLTWDLRMLPEELERAFWSESTEQFCQQDFMVRDLFVAAAPQHTLILSIHGSVSHGHDGSSPPEHPTSFLASSSAP